jgi:hypothetical protein
VKQLKTEVFGETVVRPLHLIGIWNSQLNSCSVSVQKQGKICLVTGIIQESSGSEGYC